MKFKKYNDGKYRAIAEINTKDGKKTKALFTTSVHPSEVIGWEQSEMVTKEGFPVMLPRPEEVEVDVKEIGITVASEEEVQSIKVNW